MNEPLPLWVYLGYGAYVVYTGSYAYNRKKGRSAQFFTSRVRPEDDEWFKFFTDCCVAVLFFLSLLTVAYMVATS